LPYGQTDVKIITLIALAMMVFGPMAAATVWSSGSYGFESGSVTWPTKEVSVQGVTKLGGAASQASVRDQTASAVELGNNSSQEISQEETVAVAQLGNDSIQVASQEETAATVQLGSSSSSVSAQAPASGTVQLSGYYDNMGGYTNIFYPIKMLGGTFSSSGGGGCGCS
jgi:hypothetical protein